MTLKEKFGILELDDPYIFMCESDTEKCEQIADEYAIGFAEWTCGRYIKLHSVWVGIYTDQRNKENWKTTKELLEIYKKEKGL
jgi:hypothetical protein